jgi:hypothetical protein
MFHISVDNYTDFGDERDEYSELDNLTNELNEDPDLLDKIEDKNMTLDSKDDDEDEDIKHGFDIFNQNGSEEGMKILPLKGDILTEDERSKNFDRKKSNILNLHIKDPKPRATLKQELHKPPVNMSKTVAAATLSRDNMNLFIL